MLHIVHADKICGFVQGLSSQNIGLNTIKRCIGLIICREFSLCRTENTKFITRRCHNGFFEKNWGPSTKQLQQNLLMLMFHPPSLQKTDHNLISFCAPQHLTPHLNSETNNIARYMQTLRQGHAMTFFYKKHDHTCAHSPKYVVLSS